MIIYDLKCEKGHRFEGWFRDRIAFEEQKSQKLVLCPTCGACDVEMLLSALSVVGKESAAAPQRGPRGEISLPQALRLFRECLEKNFDDVGDRFAEVALKIHHGEESEGISKERRPARKKKC